MNKLEKYLLDNKDKNILLLVSGGSAFEMLKEINKETWNKNITMGMIDERYSDDPNINNFCQLERLGLKVQTLRPAGTSLDGEAVDMEKQWKDWVKNNPYGEVVVLLGMGEDGHTAGIMPYPGEKELFDKLFVKTDKWVVAYDCGDKNQYRERITATIYFLWNLADKCFVYLRGEKKEIVFESRTYKKLEEIPVKVVEKMSFERL